jgi:hypothetical protein
VSAGIHDAVLAALESTPVLPRDQAAIALAARYAERLDDLFDLEAGDAAAEDAAAHARITLEITRMGGRLEALLDRLGMTPAARPVVPNGGGERGGSTPEADALAQLERDAAAGAPSSGIDYAAGVDPAVAEADAED